MNLREAIQRFRALGEAATTSGSLGLTTTNTGLPFYGRAGLASIEKQRKARMRRQKKTKCRGYDPACRDKEWEVPVPTGGVALLRRAKMGER